MTAISSNPTQTPQMPGSTLSPRQLQEIEKAAENFQAMFYSEMFSHMFSGVEVDPAFGGGRGEQIFRGMMIQEYGKQMAKSPSGIGLGHQLQDAMIRMQEIANSQR